MSTDLKIQLLEEHRNGAISAKEVCGRLGIHRTTLWRLRRKWERSKGSTLAHGLTGRRSNGAQSEEFRRYVCGLYARYYRPYGVTAHAFYQNVARGLPDYVNYWTLLSWLRAAGLVDAGERCISRFRKL
jgi:transposase